MGNCTSIPILTLYSDTLDEHHEFKPIVPYETTHVKPQIIRPIVHNLCR
jgi:hypothetical protein